MPPVLSRGSTDFATRRVIVEKVVDRRLGHESPSPPDSWKWDYRHVAEDYIAETLPCPGLKRNHLLSLPREYWQNGPLAGKQGDSAKVTEVKELFAGGRVRWVPLIHNGEVSVWRDLTYIFSDDSVVEVLDAASIDSGGRSTHTLQKTLRSGSPIVVTIFRRDLDNEYLPWRSFVRREHFSGTLDSDGVEQTTRDGDTFYWSNVDTTKREFTSYARDGQIHLLFNQSVYEPVTSTTDPSTILDFNDLEYVGTTDGSDDQRLETSRFPVSDDAYLKVYVVDTGASTWTEYTVVDTFTAADQVKVDCDFGVLTFGTSASGSTSPPPVNSAIYVMYRTVPRIEYEEEEYRDTLTAVEADVNPLGQSMNHGFLTFARASLDIASIVLTTTKPRYTGGLTEAYGPVYVGADYAPLLATVYSSSGEVVPNVEVTFSLPWSTSNFGSLGGSALSTQRRTGYDGIARGYYVPPTSVDSMGFYVRSVTDTNKLSLPSDAYFSEVTDIYTYYVLKDDPFMGIVGADTSIGEVEWSTTLLNGRRVIYYKWDATAINPISGHSGAYAPVRPTTVTDGQLLTYADTLTVPDPSASTTNLGAYWVVSDRYVNIRASAFSPRWNKTIYSNDLTLRINIPEYMKGSYISDALLDIPFGWRLPDDDYDVASALDGATYISINPVSGPYPIVDVIGGDNWDPYVTDGPPPFFPDSGYPVVGIPKPFAQFSLFWDIV